MSKQEIMVGSTDKTLYFHIRKKSDGTPLTGLVFNSTNLQSYYQRDLAAPVQIPLVTQTVTGVHTDGGFVEVDAINTPGLYRLDVPDAAFITGVDCVRVYINEVTTTALGISVDPAEIQLTTFEKSDPTSIDRLVNIDEATSPSEISDYMDANSVKLALLTAINALTVKLETALESDGLTGYRYTGLALENAPSGTGGDATLENQTTILANLAIVDVNVDEVLIDTDDLQSTKGERVTAVGFNTVEPDNQGIVDIEAKVDLLQVDSTFNKDMLGGDKEFVGTQEIDYKAGTTTEVARFNLSKDGVASLTSPDKRERV